MPATALPFVRSEQSNSLDRGAAIYGAPWIPSIYHQSMLALIYQHHGSVMGYSIHLSGRITCVTFVMYSSHLSQPVLMFPWLEFVLSWSIPLHPMVLLIIIPFLNGYNWEYTLFSDKPILIACFAYVLFWPGRSFTRFAPGSSKRDRVRFPALGFFMDVKQPLATRNMFD